MLSKENQLKVAGLSAVLATTLGLGGALVAPATALAAAPDGYIPNPGIANSKGNGNLTIEEVEGKTDGKNNDYKLDQHEDKQVKVVEVVRLFNPWTGDHLFTTDAKEVFNAEKAGWTNEGTIWKAYGHEGDYRKFVTYSGKCGTPVYRLYNQYTGEHLYTTSSEEYNTNVAGGWTGEGVSYYTVNAKDGKPVVDEKDTKIKTPKKVDAVYRMFNPFATVGTHLYGGVEENAKCLADGWKADNVVDGKQQPMFEVFDLDHTTNEAKIAQALARIDKEYKANLEKYKALEKKLVDATMSGSKYDKDAELNGIKAVQEVTTALSQEMTDVQFYLNKLQYQAKEIKDSLDGKHGAAGSNGFALASEVVFEKENYKKQKDIVAEKETADEKAKAELAKKKLAQTVAQLDLEVYKNDKKDGLAAAQKKLEDLKTKLAQQTEAKGKAAVEQEITNLKDKNHKDGDLGKAEAKVKDLQDKLDAAVKETKKAQKDADDAAAALKLAKANLANFKLLFNENIKKFNDYRHTLGLSEAQATRDLAAYEKYSMVFTDLNAAITKLANKEKGLVDCVNKDENVKAYNKAIKAANALIKTDDTELPDYSKVKQAVQDVLDPYFMDLVPDVDDMPF